MVPLTNRWRLRGIHTSMFVVVVLGCIVSLDQQVHAQGAKKPTAAEPVDPIKSAFDEAMAQPLGQRIGQLESLSRKINDDMFQGRLDAKQSVNARQYQFHAQLQLARYPEACEAYSQYVVAVKRGFSRDTARYVLERDMSEWERQHEYALAASLCAETVKGLDEDPELASMALYYEGRSRFRTNGTMKECVELCKRLIEQYPRTSPRPRAMRLLANAYIALADHDSALGTLALLKQQYAGTEFESYADMRAAIVVEAKGDSARALQIYQQSLTTYPDHMYAPYIHREMDRLQKRIEEGLIKDALKEMGRKDAPVECGSVKVVRYEGTQSPNQIARGADSSCLSGNRVVVAEP